MTRAQQIGNILGIFLPVAGLALAVVLLWNRFVGAGALAIMAVMYLLTGIGVTVGLHRLLAHRSFEAAPAVRGTLAVLGTMAMQGPVIRWVTNHRKHHVYTDEEGDPHSPHLTGRRGVLGAVVGLWHSHVGWIFKRERAPYERYARDLVKDPVILFVGRTALLWVALGLALPAAAGFLFTGTLAGAGIALLWGGAVRIFLVHHMTFAINSLCHFVGRRLFDTDDHSRNVFWLAPLSMGESWHNNHHAFPTSAFHGLRRWQLDLGGWVIRGLEAARLAHNVQRVSPERMERKLHPTSRNNSRQVASTQLH
jgi:stearoyl-CoA desaturase (Delta-9 desaturase)